MTAYRLRRFLLPAALAEPFGAALWEAGSLGCEVEDAAPGTARLTAYFPDPPPAASRLDLKDWRTQGVELLADEPFADRDWLAGYRSTSAPIDVGARFRIDPRDVDEDGRGAAVAPSPDGRTVVRIPAQTAFGTGSHESTRLAVAWLEALELRGRDVLDVGTGSGILAFLALHLGARSAVGFDVDAQAVCIARANARLNGLEPRLFAGRLAALGPAAAFDVALANILPEHVLGELPALLRALRPGGLVVSSGNLAARRDELLTRFAGAGLHHAAERRDGEWIAFLLTRDEGGGRTGAVERA